LEELIVSSNPANNDLRYARRAALRVKRDQVENFLAKMHERVLPSLKEREGIRRIYLLRGPEGGNEFISLTFWNDKSHADSYGSSETSAKNTESTRDFLESDPLLTEFDVEYHYVNAEDLPPKSTEQVVTHAKRTFGASRVNKRRRKSKKR
jgi:heme-degrading monooxygenase HmoA